MASRPEPTEICLTPSVSSHDDEIRFASSGEIIRTQIGSQKLIGLSSQDRVHPPNSAPNPVQPVQEILVDSPV